MKHLIYFSLVVVLTSTTGISQINTTYALEDFTRDQIEIAIDSIWNEVVSWDEDTSQLVFLKREKYANELKKYYLDHTVGNTEYESPEGKALLYSFFIRFRNNNHKMVIENFIGDLDGTSPELWNIIYPLYSKSLKAEFKENKGWVSILEQLAEADTSSFHKVVIWRDLALHYYYGDYDTSSARNYFEKIINKKSLFLSGVLHKRILEAESFVRQINNLQVGSRAPNFCTEDINDVEICVNPSQNKVFLLEFWATWCAPCRADLPKIHLIYDMYKDRNDFQLIGISLDQNTESLSNFIEENEMNWPQIFEGGKDIRKGKVTLLYNGLAQPTYYVIDKDGIIQYNHDSRMKGKDLELVLEEVMKE